MAKVTIDRKAFKAVALFKAVQDVRYYLNGIFVEFNPMETRIVATDGHTLAVHRADAKDDNEGSGNFIIPLDAIKQILSWKLPAKSMHDVFTITVPDGFLVSNFELRADFYGNACVFKPIEGTFPNYRKVIPDTASGEITHLNPDYLARCDEAVAIIKDNKKTTAHASIAHNGPNNAVIVAYDGIPELCMVVMPMRMTAPDVALYQWAKAELPELPVADVAETVTKTAETVTA